MHAKIPRDEAERLLSPRYEFLDVLGAGASAVVYKISDRARGGEIKAAKITRLEEGEFGAEQLEGLREEFRFAANLFHPNLVRYYDLDIKPSQDFAVITMECVAGSDFGSALNKGRTEDVCHAAAELLRGLQFLHECGFVHGDIKPSNVLCAGKGLARRVKLLDYHLALRSVPDAENAPRGTLRYMAPEVVAGNSPTPASDLYSVGVLLYELLTGQALFSGTPQEVAAQHASALADSDELNNIERGEQLRPLISRLLAKRPGGRYASAAEVIRELSSATGYPTAVETRETLLARVRSADPVSRTKQIDRFKEKLSSRGDVAPKTPEIVIVEGRSGSGKTRCLRECHIMAQTLGFAVFETSGAASGEEIADLLTAQVCEETEKKTGEKSRSQNVLTELETWRNPTSSTGPKLVLSAKLMARLNRVVDGISESARQRPVMLIADNLNRIEPDGIHALSFIMRGLMEQPVVLYASIGEDENSLKSVESLIGNPPLRVPMERLALEDIGPDDKRILIARMLPEQVEPDILDSLAVAWAGIPGLIADGLEHLILTGALYWQDGHCVLKSVPMDRFAPDRIGDIAAQMLEVADTDAKRLLRLMAVAHGEVSLSTLAEAAGIELLALRTLIARPPFRGAISTRMVENGELCRFQHLAIGDKIAATLTPEEKKSLHVALADAMIGSTSSYATSSGVAIVEHYLQGGRPESAIGLMLQSVSRSGAERYARQWLPLLQRSLPHAGVLESVQLLEKVGDLCLSSGDFAEARNLFARAVTLTEGAGMADLRPLRKYAQACVSLGRHQAAREAAVKILKACAGAEGFETTHAAEAELVLARVDTRTGHLDEALRHAQEAERIANILGDKILQAHALQRQGEILIEKGVYRESGEKLVQALMLFRSGKDKIGIARILHDLGHVAMSRNRWRQAANFLDRALAILKQEGHLEEAARTVSYLGGIYQRLCQWDTACERYEEALPMYERLSYSRGVAALLANLAQMNTYRGYLDSALKQCGAAVAKVPDEPDLKSRVLLRKASTCHFVGDLSSARQAALAALEVAKHCGTKGPSEFAHRLLGEIALLSGRNTDAQNHLNTALELARAESLVDREAVCLARLAEVALAEKNVSTALRLAWESIEKAEKSGLEGMLAIACTARGEAELAAGNLENARAQLLRADEFLRKTPLCGNLMTTCLNLGKVYLALGQYHFSGYYLRNCLDVVEQVAGRFESPDMRRVFLADPRRTDVFQTIAVLKEKTIPGANSDDE